MQVQSARTYDFTLGPGGTQRLEVIGDLVKITEATGLLRIRLDTGWQIDALAGQGLRLPPFADGRPAFQSITLLDLSGATNTGKLVAGSAAVIDDRIAGTVDIRNPDAQASVAARAFQGFALKAGVGGQYAKVQLWNPAASGKRLLLRKLWLQTFGGTQNVVGAIGTTLYLGAITQGVQNALGNGAAPAAQLAGETSAAQLAAQSLYFASTRAVGVTGTDPYEFVYPIVLPPGYGYAVASDAASVTLGASFEWEEQTI